MQMNWWQHNLDRTTLAGRLMDPEMTEACLKLFENVPNLKNLVRTAVEKCMMLQTKDG